LYFVVESTQSPPPVAVSATGPTLEDLTRQMLQPMLKAWLDENLDAIVRARVDEEVERISRGRVR
jgi:cell pole-organizing protein PopZ